MKVEIADKNMKEAEELARMLTEALEEDITAEDVINKVLKEYLHLVYAEYNGKVITLP